MKVMVNSIPKGGTHLLLKLVYLLGVVDDPKRFWLGAGVIRRGVEPVNKLLKGSYKKETIEIGCEVPVSVGSEWLKRRLSKVPDGHAFGAHCLYSRELADLIEEVGVRPLCVIRDPRAIAVSHMHYVKGWKGHFFFKEYMNLPSDAERLLFSILGGRLGKYELRSLKERYMSFMGWMEDSRALVVKFESLVGPSGGGHLGAQREVILKVARYLGFELSPSDIDRIQSALFGKNNTSTQSQTFRKGKIDAWRQELDDALIERVEEELSDILQQLGYVT